MEKMAELELEEIKRKEKSRRKPWVLLLIVILFYLIVILFGAVRFVWSNLIYLQTGDIEQFSAKYFIRSSVGDYYRGFILDGLGSVIILYLMIKGLLNRKRIFLTFAFIETIVSILIYSLVSIAYYDVYNHGGIFLFSLVGEKVSITGEDWWGGYIFIFLIVIHILKGYILLRKDVRGLFQQVKEDDQDFS